MRNPRKWVWLAAGLWLAGSLSAADVQALGSGKKKTPEEEAADTQHAFHVVLPPSVIATDMCLRRLKPVIGGGGRPSDRLPDRSGIICPSTR